ncbi:MAG: hypothetical protein ACI9UN_001391 [Granulosicoccus sp.]
MSNSAFNLNRLLGRFKHQEIAPNDRQPGQKQPQRKLGAPKQLDKRAISGDRVVCACSMQLPKLDPFKPLNIHRKGYLIFNMRGGAFYISQQFTDHTVKQMFKAGKASLIKDIILYPGRVLEIVLGDIKARFLYFTDTQPLPGMVLRFSDLSEEQLNKLNLLTDELPKIGASEKSFIAKALKRKNEVD